MTLDFCSDNSLLVRSGSISQSLKFKIDGTDENISTRQNLTITSSLELSSLEWMELSDICNLLPIIYSGIS
jgi:hypothetical protein